MNSTRSQKRLALSKNVVDIVGSDRLSEMPDEVIVHILSFMPIVDAVRTVLLRRFGNLWTLVPSLSFDYYDFRSAFSREWVRSKRGDGFKPFALFVRNVLMLHRRTTINKFSLELPRHYCDENIEYIEDIKMWLRFALGREVKELDCYSENWYDRDECLLLPALASQSLVKLELYGCEIPRHLQIQLGSLKELHLENVDVCNEGFQNLISGCPSLEELHITYPMALEELRFTAPSIQKLNLTLSEQGREPCFLDCPNLKNLELDALDFVPDVIDLSSVDEFTIIHMSYSGYENEGFGDKYIKFLQKLEKAKTFKLSTDASMGFFHLINKLDPPQNRWKRVILNIYHFGEDFVLGFTRFAKTFGQLEELIIYTETNWGSEPNRRMLPVFCLLPKLKNVTMHGYTRYFKGHLQLIEILLKGAVVLDMLRIVPGKWRLTAAEELDFVKRVSCLPRISSNAKIVFT